MAETSNGRARTLILWTLAAILLVIVFFVVRRLTREELPLRVAQATMQDLITTDSTNGKVEPQHNFEAHAPAPGTVKSLYVHAGESVPKGKLLLALDDADAIAHTAGALASLRGAQAQYQATERGGTQEERYSLAGALAKAQMDRDQAQRDLDAVKKLAAQGAAAPSEVTSAQQRLDAVNTSLATLEKRKTARYSPADLAHSHADLEQAQSAYSAASTVVADSNVRAPFPGTVYYLPVSVSEYVHPGDLLLEMADLTKLQVRAYFDEPELGSLHTGQPATIVWDALPNRTWHGRILRMPSTIINYQNTRNVGEVLVSVDDADGKLLPNTNVKVTVTEQRLDNVLTVPREALHSENGKNYVYLLHGRVLRRQPVTVGALNLTQVQIVKGLTENATVALSTTNGEPLAEGVPVHIDR
ncbi:MAG TPA: efflux RND transporter periplasmic adaptor subunit [Acidobacteriaceae bacterium]|jgi:HlyD family secretion protein|nr:efflux RND transporter periplasmic adaptor subunit [Acidobacteriaceae bacterium]